MKAGNGRLYDAKLGRFLSPDNFVQDPFSTQSFNRYGYVVNNPLSYTDESGEFFFIPILIGAVVGGVFNTVTHLNQIHSFKDGLVAFGIGAVAGGVGAATGGAAFLAAGGSATVAGAGGFIAGAVGGAVGSAVSSPIQSLGNHLYFGDPMITLKQWGAGILIGAAVGGTINGGIAAFKGNNFWNGNSVAQGRGVFSFNNTPKYTASNTSYGSVSTDGLERVINPETISETLEGFDIKAYSSNPIYKAQVDEYLNQMNNGTFDASKGGAGFINNNQALVTDGHHRIIAATIRGMQTDDYSILQSIINNGNFSLSQASQYGYNSFSKFPIVWK